MAKEPHDKVYSLFRLTSNVNEYKIIVNYEVSVCQLYTSIFENYIRLEGNLSIILPRQFGDNPYNLPSWCPDWSSSKPASKLGNIADVRHFPVPKHRPPYCAAGPDSVPRRVRFSYPGLIMNACGWLLDSIQENFKSVRRLIIMEPRTLTDFTPLLLLLCFPWGRRRQPPIECKGTDFDIWYAMHRRALPRFFSKGGARVRGTEYVTKAYERYCREKHEAFFDILLRTINLYIGYNREPRSVARLWRRNIDMPERYSRVNEVITPALREMTISLGEIKINENYACFFITQHGYMGLGPRDLRNDDLICILQGCEFPVVLRTVDYSFRLIGAAYVQGFMHGQLLEPRRAMNLLEVEFQIC